MVRRCPKMLSYNLDHTIIPKVQLLRNLNVSVVAIIEPYPQIFGLSIKHNILPKIRYLQSIGVKDPMRLIMMTPQVLSLNIERTLNPKIERMKAAGVKDIPQLLYANPQALFPYLLHDTFQYATVLKLNSERNLVPKLDFLLGPMGLRTNELQRCAAIFSLSLEKRIQPRFAQIEEIGILEKGQKTSNNQTERHKYVLSLKRWLLYSEPRYQKALKEVMSGRGRKLISSIDDQNYCDDIDGNDHNMIK
eukprot:jgi/Bigna1/73456/fgenesh1_pg.24_\